MAVFAAEQKVKEFSLFSETKKNLYICNAVRGAEPQVAKLRIYPMNLKCIMTAQGNGILHYWNLIITNMPYHPMIRLFYFYIYGIRKF